MNISCNDSMNKLQRRIKRISTQEKHKLKHCKDPDNSKMDFAEDSSDSGFDAESRSQLMSRRNSASSTIFDCGSNDLDRDSSDDSIDSGIFGISNNGEDVNLSDTSNTVAGVTLIEETGLANLLCHSISINEDDVKALQYYDDNATEPPQKRRCIFPKAVGEKVSEMQMEMAGSTSAINLYGIAHQTDLPQLTACRSSSSSKKSISANHNLNSRRKLNRKPPSLHATYPSRVKDGQIDLRIISQPEEQHRARYMTEGSRGAIKDRRGSGFPTVKLFGYNQPVTLQVFIGSDQGKIQPHLFYQACKVSGKNCTPCSERIIDGTTVIEISMLPDKDMTVSCDCIGILKERNVDVEQRLPYFNMTRAKKKNTRCRMIFRVNLPLVELGIDTLQAASSPILCTQPPGIPEICKKSIKECSVVGGTELFIIGKNFLKDTKIIFEQELYDADNKMNKIWQEVVEPEKEFLHQTHLVCRVPPYRYQSVSDAVKVHLIVQSGGKTSEPHTFTYLPVKQGLDNVTGNFQAIASGIPGSQTLAPSQLMPTFIQVPAPLTTASIPTVVVSQSPNFAPYSRGLVPDSAVKCAMNQKVLQSSPKVIKTALSKIADENGCNSNQIHVVVLQQQQQQQQQSERNMKRVQHFSSVNRLRNNSFCGKRLLKLNHKGKLLAASKGKHFMNQPYPRPKSIVNQLLTNTTQSNAVLMDQLTADTIVANGENGLSTSDVIVQEINATTVQGFASELTANNVEPTDLFTATSIIPSATDIHDSQNCLQTNGMPTQTIVSGSSQSLLESNMLTAAEMQSMMDSGRNLLQTQPTIISPNTLIENSESLLGQQLNQSIKSNAELAPNVCQAIHLENELSNNEICLAITQNELLSIQDPFSGMCTTMADNKANELKLKQEVDSKEFMQQTVILRLENDEMKAATNSPVIHQNLSQSTNFIALEASGQNCMNNAILHAPQLQAEEILTLSANNSVAVNNTNADLSTLPHSFVGNSSVAMTQPEPLLSQVAQLNSSTQVTSCLGGAVNLPQVAKFIENEVKQEKPAQCDMNMFQHTMTNAFSMLSESDLLSFINPSTFDNL